MKYIKTFENRFKQKYEFGDYIYFEELEDFSDGMRKVIKSGKIIGKSVNGNMYDILTDDENNTILIYEFDMIRKMTPEEIEKFKTEISANKYNL